MGGHDPPKDREMKTLTNRPRNYHHRRNPVHRVPKNMPNGRDVGFYNSFAIVCLSRTVAIALGEPDVPTGVCGIPGALPFVEQGNYHKILSDESSPYRPIVIAELTRLLKHDPCHEYFLHFMEIQWDQFLMGTKDDNSVLFALPSDVIGVIYKHLRSD